MRRRYYNGSQKKWDGMEKDWVHMAQDRDKQWDLVNVVMNRQVL